MASVRAASRTYLRLVAADMRAQAQYRFSFAADVVGAGIGMLTEFAAILVLFQHAPALGGWSVWEVAMLYGSAEVALSLARSLMAGFDSFPEMVRLGNFDRVLTRPMSSFLQIAASEVNLRQLGRLAQGAGVLGLAIAAVGPAWSVLDWLFLAWTLLGGVLFFAGLFVIGGAFSFWTVESLEAMNILTYGGAGMASYPMSIYSRWLRDVFVFLIPLAFVNYYPFVLLLDKPDPIGLPPEAALAAWPLCAAVFLVGRAFWELGVRHYQGTGT